MHLLEHEKLTLGPLPTLFSKLLLAGEVSLDFIIETSVSVLTRGACSQLDLALPNQIRGCVYVSKWVRICRGDGSLQTQW